MNIVIYTVVVFVLSSNGTLTPLPTNRQFNELFKTKAECEELAETIERGSDSKIIAECVVSAVEYKKLKEVK